jgi:hypothetical protein
MGMREVRVYDRDFASFEEMLAGVSADEAPQEVWLSQVAEGEFAVRYKDFKTGCARNPLGQHVQSAEICRIFSSINEAAADSRNVVKEYWTVRCFLYDHTGTLIKTVSNDRQVAKFAYTAYARLFVSLAAYAVLGMGLLRVLLGVCDWMIGPRWGNHFEPSHWGWLPWMAYALAGLVIVVVLWLLRILLTARRRVDRTTTNLNAILTPEDKKRFDELNTLHGTRDPVERERLLKLTREYQQKVRDSLKQ